MSKRGDNTRLLLLWTLLISIAVSILNVWTFHASNASMTTSIVHHNLETFTHKGNGTMRLTRQLRKEELAHKVTEADVLEDNYFQQALSGKHRVAQKLEPLHVMRVYMEQHSQEVLESEFNACNHQSNVSLCKGLKDRKFLVGVYNCPEEAGNRLHRFMNGLFWAINTNRTFLWRYNDYNVCLEYPRKEPGEYRMEQEALPQDYCDNEFRNTSESDCNQVLERASWIPSWEEWKSKLQLPPAVRAAGPPQKDKWATPYDRPDSPKLIRTNFQLEPTPVYHIAKNHGLGEVLSVAENWERARRLASRGYFFFYGMALEALFSFRQSAEASLVPKNKDIYFLHSRHPFPQQDGSNVQPERECMKKLLQNRTVSRPCHFMVMTDRPKALSLLKKMIEIEFDCGVSYINKKTNLHQPVRVEHGPFSGIGFFQDYALARTARAGFVAYHKRPRAMIRTSSSLIRSTIEFRRSLEVASLDELPPFPGCVNGNLPLKFE